MECPHSIELRARRSRWTKGRVRWWAGGGGRVRDGGTGECLCVEGGGGARERRARMGTTGGECRGTGVGAGGRGWETRDGGGKRGTGVGCRGTSHENQKCNWIIDLDGKLICIPTSICITF